MDVEHSKELRCRDSERSAGDLERGAHARGLVPGVRFGAGRSC